jgi:hypothetical protein
MLDGLRQQGEASGIAEEIVREEFLDNRLKSHGVVDAGKVASLRPAARGRRGALIGGGSQIPSGDESLEQLANSRDLQSRRHAMNLSQGERSMLPDEPHDAPKTGREAWRLAERLICETRSLGALHSVSSGESFSRPAASSVRAAVAMPMEIMPQKTF